MGRPKTNNMGDAAPKKKSFRKYSYRGVDLENLLVMPMADLMELVHARARRRCPHTPPPCSLLMSPDLLWGSLAEAESSHMFVSLSHYMCLSTLTQYHVPT